MDLKKINDYTWEIPKTGEMKVPTVIYTSSKLLEGVKRDRTLQQARNVACLPGTPIRLTVPAGINPGPYHVICSRMRVLLEAQQDRSLSRCPPYPCSPVLP